MNWTDVLGVGVNVGVAVEVRVGGTEVDVAVWVGGTGVVVGVAVGVLVGVPVGVGGAAATGIFSTLTALEKLGSEVTHPISLGAGSKRICHHCRASSRPIISTVVPEGRSPITS